VKHTFHLSTEAKRPGLIAWAQKCPVGWHVDFRQPTRSLDQNAKLWACLTDVSEQVDWHGNKLAPVEWKDVFTAAQKGQKAVPGIDGGFVILGAHTSKMTVAEMSDLLELIFAFGAQHGVKFNDGEL
jgi:hypothetical protein